MKFDVVLGNPPYQISDGGAQASAKPIYHYFVKLSNELTNYYSSFIIPSRWYVGGKGLDNFREDMLNDNHIKELHDCLTPEDIFPYTNIRGGVCYFLRDFNYNNKNKLVKVFTHESNNIIYKINRSMKINKANVFNRDGRAKDILTKICKDNFSSIAQYISPLRPFGLRGYFSKLDKFKENQMGLKEPILCYAKGRKIGYVEKKEILSHLDWGNNWKVFMPRANNIGTELNDDNLNSFVGKPNEICTESYLVIGAELNLDEISSANLAKYMKTKFLRYLHSLLKSSQDATSKTFEFVPIQDFTNNSDINWSRSIHEIDVQLYNKYNLTDDEVLYIEGKIKEMK